MHITKITLVYLLCLYPASQPPWKFGCYVLLISLLYLLNVTSSFEVEILKNTLVGHLTLVMYLGNVIEGEYLVFSLF